MVERVWKLPVLWRLNSPAQRRNSPPVAQRAASERTSGNKVTQTLRTDHNRYSDGVSPQPGTSAVDRLGAASRAKSRTPILSRWSRRPQHATTTHFHLPSFRLRSPRLQVACGVGQYAVVVLGRWVAQKGIVRNFHLSRCQADVCSCHPTAYSFRKIASTFEMTSRLLHIDLGR